MIIYKITDNREYIVLYIPHLRGKLKCTKRKIRHGNPGSQNNKKKIPDRENHKEYFERKEKGEAGKGGKLKPN